jgi:DNA-binding MarR family transcriptional regulator
MPNKKLVPPDATPAGRLVEAQLHHVLGYQLAQATIATTIVFMKEVGEPCELRPVEYTILSLINENPNGSSTQLAQALAVTAPNITMWIDKLEGRGLVQRQRSETDKRAQHLRLTDKGSALVASATERLLAGERQAFAHLSDGERTILVELLHKVARSRPANGMPKSRPAWPNR